MNIFGYIYQTYRNSVKTLVQLKTLQATCDEILSLLKPGPAVAIQFFVEGEQVTRMDITVTQQFDVSVVITDAKGNPAQIDGAAQWSTDNSDVLDVQADASNTLLAHVKAKGPIGSAKVTVSVDADLGAGVKPLIGMLDVNVTAGEATVITLTPGPVTEQGSGGGGGGGVP